MALNRGGKMKKFFPLLLLCWAVLVICLVFFGMDTAVTTSEQNQQAHLPWFERFVEHEFILDNLDEPLMTLFTTFDVSDTFRQQIYKNTITLWPQLGPNVRLILFLCDNIVQEDPLVAIKQLAIKHGWKLKVTPCEPNLHLPMFRHLFLEAQKIYQTTFYVFAKPDMLFDMSLVGTLTALTKGLSENVVAKRTRMLGFGALTAIDVGETREISSLAEVTSIGHKEGQSFSVTDVDYGYFITTRSIYPWISIPDFVVSRVLFDSWTVNFFVKNRFMTFDLTDTILAAHQGDGRPPVPSETLVGAFHNRDLMEDKFSWREGIITCSEYKSKVTDDRKRFQLWERVKKGFCGAKIGTPEEMRNQTRYQLMMQEERVNLFRSIYLL